MRLRRSPKPGALTATPVNVPRSLFTTSVARDSPSTSSAMISSDLPDWLTASSTGRMSRTEPIFELAMRTYGSSRTASMRSWSVTRSEEHTSELQSRQYLACRLLLEKKNTAVYYSLIDYGSASSWLLSDTTMFVLLCHLLDARMPKSLSIV